MNKILSSKLIIFAFLFISIGNLTPTLIVQAEVSDWSQETGELFLRYEFQYQKFKEHLERKDVDMACEYVKRAYKILINNYAQFNREIPEINWNKYRTTLKNGITICNRS